MYKVLDLEYVDNTNPFSIDNQTEKVTLTGIPFTSWKGLRNYLITGSKYPEYLHKDQRRVGKEAYVYLPDLNQILEETLRNYVDSLLLIKLRYDKDTDVIWTQAGLNKFELEWLQVVKKVVVTL